MNEKMPRTPFSTPLSGSAKETELRLKHIFSGPKKRPPVLFLALMFSVCIFCGNLVSCHMTEAETPDTYSTDTTVRAVPVDQEHPPASEEEEWLLQALFLAADEEEPFQVPTARLLASLEGDGCVLAAALVEDFLENTLILGVVDRETEALAGPIFRTSCRNAVPEIVTYQQEGTDNLLYTFNGWVMADTGEAGLIRFDGENFSWLWPVEGDVREETVYQEYRSYWNGHLAKLVPGGVDLYTSNPDFTYGQQEPELLWQFDHRETFYPAPEAAAARSAYVRELEDLLYRYTLPDGYVGSQELFDDLSENTFALADVDGDGREELVLLTRPTIYAGYVGYILDYDKATDSVRTQFEGFPSFTFYSNGALAEDDSHAQGSWTSEFWPHTLYRYLPETDSYEAVGHLDAWEKVMSDINEGNLPPFPTEKDTSGAGILYYIKPAEYLRPNSSEGYVKTPVDQSVYLEWLEPYLGDAQPVELEYLPLTKENIDRIKLEDLS